MEISEVPAPARMAGLPSWLLGQTAAFAYRLVSEQMAALNARPYHYRLLVALDELGPASQAEIGRRSGIHLSDLVTAINELADRELVLRAPDPADRRRNVISLTPAGRRHLRQLGKRVVRAQDQLLAPLDPAEREQLTGLLGRVLDHHVRRNKSGS